MASSSAPRCSSVACGTRPMTVITHGRQQIMAAKRSSGNNRNA